MTTPYQTKPVYKLEVNQKGSQCRLMVKALLAFKDRGFRQRVRDSMRTQLDLLLGIPDDEQLKNTLVDIVRKLMLQRSDTSSYKKLEANFITFEHLLTKSMSKVRHQLEKFSDRMDDDLQQYKRRLSAAAEPAATSTPVPITEARVMPASTEARILPALPIAAVPVAEPKKNVHFPPVGLPTAQPPQKQQQQYPVSSGTPSTHLYAFDSRAFAGYERKLPSINELFPDQWFGGSQYRHPAIAPPHNNAYRS